MKWKVAIDTDGASIGEEKPMRYTFLQHLPSGEVWAAKVDDQELVIGVSGPLAATEISDSRLPEFNYRSDQQLLADFNDRRDEFVRGLIPDAAEPV
jgi:hypothetical protein